MLVIICLFILTAAGVVIGGQEPSCGSTGPSCPNNEHYTKNNPICQRTCANRHVPRRGDCKPYTGCVCDDHLMRLYDNATGPCIPKGKCPNKCTDSKAVYTQCPSPCPLTCDEPHPKPCNKMCVRFGCECAPGYVLTKIGGRCVRPKDCPANQCNDSKAVYTECPSPCPLTCDEPNPKPCNKMCVRFGCECAPGYVLTKIGGRCVRPKDCPARCPKNEHYVENDETCLKTCGNRQLPRESTAGACQPFTGCVCDPGFARKYDNATGSCIPVKSCPPIPKCGVNEVSTSCRIICPPQNCESIYSLYYCLPTECEPGCDCRDNYLRNSDGDCILSDDCFKQPLPECGPNEIATECAQQCPPQSCESIYTTYMCAEQKCTAGCNCIDGYLRNSSGDCIPSEDCFKGTGCYGDLNATHVDCGSACPETCEEPDSGRACIDVCVLNGCECNPGYILSKSDGVCIAPEDCPGGSPMCGANQTYVGCNVKCPTDYCAEDDSRAMVACSAPYPCPGGCACQSGYLLKSRDDKRCILASDCSPVNCTRSNEVWKANPSNCYLERCEDRGKICDYPYPAQPRCVCQAGYYRNESDICIPESECPDLGCNGDPNAMPADCPSSCPPTCANRNSDRTEACIQLCDPSGCVCKPGFILTEVGGRCVTPEECPADLGCNGDPNAMPADCPSSCPPTCANRNSDRTQACIQMCDPSGCVCKPGFILTEVGGRCVTPEECPAELECNDRNATSKTCPSPCQPTCDEPNADVPCIEVCLPDGCVCKQGYLRAEKDGNCIKPEDCPGASPTCRANETYVYCKVGCPDNYCRSDDSLAEVACDPIDPCPGGCACKEGYLMLSYEDDRCILAYECPPANCTRRNEVWDPSPPKCFRERCDDRNTPCDFPYQRSPRCVCQRGYYRNEDGICVLESECPVAAGCLGYPNTQPTPCLSNCPATCCEPDSDRPCDPCTEPGCECKPGYILSEPDGECILTKDCPGGTPCCPNNMTYTSCKPDCPTIYCPAEEHEFFKICDPVLPCHTGCVCAEGYLWISKVDKTCVLAQDCPPVVCTGQNEEWDPEPQFCYLEKCEDREETCLDNRVGRPRCVCKEGYYRDSADECIPAADCPPLSPAPGGGTECNEPNEVWDSSSSKCVCKEGYVRDQDGSCVPDDSRAGCSGYPNTQLTPCISPCPPTCCEPEAKRPCDPCSQPGCECKPGYILSEPNGKCITPSECPGGSPVCPCNSTYTEDKLDCQPKYCPTDMDGVEITTICDPVYPANGCKCIDGYLWLNEINKPEKTCVLAADCPPVECTRKNEMWDPSPKKCWKTLEKCENRNDPCDDSSPGRPRCVCIDGYYRDQNGDCIPVADCPPPAPVPECTGANEVLDPSSSQCVCEQGYVRDDSGACVPEKPPKQECGYNEVAVPCRTICPPQNCEIAYTDYYCSEETKRCEAGCDCLPDHLRNGSGICIPNEECPYPTFPICGINEIARDCKRICPPQTCLSKYALFRCKEDIPCEAGCDCVANYLRNDEGICIPSDECPPPCGVPDECKPTCASPNPPNCSYSPAEENIDGCECKEGFVLSELGGKCIKIEDCPPGCNGDSNARAKQCPLPCPSTCQSPNAVHCLKMCEPIGCECEPGYILSNSTGMCILPEKCSGGNPCGKNEHFVACIPDCPRDYCPKNDQRGIVLCDPPNPCLSGCACNLNHKRKSRKEPYCIVSSDCTPVKCRRPKEVWDSCPPACLAEDCRDVNQQPTQCNTLVLNCEPACICEEGYFRNASDICVRAKDCPCLIPDECKQTCGSPNPSGCSYSSPNENVDGCYCKDGYILSKLGGKCIKIEDCPRDLGCNGDPHAITKSCPQPCPSTCDSPNAFHCKRKCEGIGCECEPGYLISNVTGKCILPDECPGGNPCGENEEFVACKDECPHDYCPEDDSRAVVACDPPRPCLSGCACMLNHKRKSREDPRCIVASDCSPVNCTRSNEEWCSCPFCLDEDCEDVNHGPTACALWVNCEPACICKKDYLRNATGICIPNKDCPCPVPNKCKKTCEVPNPPGCKYSPPSVNIDGCTCKEGYILSKLGGKCIKVEDCPPC